MIADLIFKIEGILWGMPFIVFVILVGAYFTVRSGFFPFVRFGHILKHTAGSIGKEGNVAKKDGRLSPWETCCIAIGGSVGAGNIAGVASAIAAGGPGAVFWLWLWAFVGMFVKLVEVSLGSYYRSKDEKGQFYGGPMEYMRKGIGIDKKSGFGFFLAGFFAVALLTVSIQGSQALSISEILLGSFGIPMMVTTIIYTIIMLYVLLGGTTRIANFATKAVPIMCVIYVIGGIGMILLNIGQVPAAIALIFKDAFTGSAAVGGFTGATVATAVRSGLNRSVNSNEAGQGTSPLIHSSADTVHPVRQGLWGAFEVFIDTLVVCSITALALIVTGVWSNGETGATLSLSSWIATYGVAGKVFMGVMAVMFGLTTTAGWFTYYATCIRYLFAKRPVLRDKLVNIFRVLFPCWNVVIVGYIVFTGQDAAVFWSLVGAVLALPVFINLIGLLLLQDKFWALFKDYKARYLGIGEVDPNFYVFWEDDPKNK